MECQKSFHHRDVIKPPIIGSVAASSTPKSPAVAQSSSPSIYGKPPAQAPRIKSILDMNHHQRSQQVHLLRNAFSPGHAPPATSNQIVEHGHQDSFLVGTSSWRTPVKFEPTSIWHKWPVIAMVAEIDFKSKEQGQCHQRWVGRTPHQCGQYLVKRSERTTEVNITFGMKVDQTIACESRPPIVAFKAATFLQGLGNWSRSAHHRIGTRVRSPSGRQREQQKQQTQQIRSQPCAHHDCTWDDCATMLTLPAQDQTKARGTMAPWASSGAVIT